MFRHGKRKGKPKKPSAAGQASSPPPVASAVSAAATSARRVSGSPAEVQSLCASPDSCASPDKKKKKHSDQRDKSDCSQDLVSRPESLPDDPVLPSSPQGQGLSFSVANLSPALEGSLRLDPELSSPPRPRSSVAHPEDRFGSWSNDDDDEDSDDDDDDDDYYDDDSDDDDDSVYKDALAAIEEDPVEDIDNDEDDPTDFHECIVPPTPASEGSKPRAVPSTEEEFAESLANHYKQQQGNRKKFAFSSFRSPTRNTAQSDVYDAYLKFCLSMFLIVLAAGYAFLPEPHMKECYNYMSRYMCMNNGLSYVYWLFGKVGSTGNGFKRLVYYGATQYKEIASRLVEHALPIISIDLLPANLQLRLTDAMLEGIKSFVSFTSVPKLTIRQAVRLEMTGLPFATQLFFFSMMTDFKECLMLSGAIKLVGCLRRLYLSTLESGAQVKLKASGAEHEAVNYTFLGWFFYEMPRVVAEVKRFFDLFPEEERRQLLEQGWTMDTAILTWPAGKLSDAPPLLASVHILFAEAIFGIGNWVDALPFPPVADPKKIQQCFDSSKYLPIQGLEAFRRIRKYVRRISRNGGFGFIDVNTVVVGLLKDLKPDQLEVGEANYMNIESLEEFFCSIMGWVRFFRSPILPIVVLKKPRLDNGMFRLLFLYNPFCYATFWNPKCTKVSLKRIRSMARTVMQCQWLAMVVAVLTTANHDLKFDVMSQLITGNLMFIWHIFAHWAIFLHLPAPVCALVFKQFLLWKFCIFDSDHTKQLRDQLINLKLVGKYARRIREAVKNTVITRYKPLQLNIGCILSRVHAPDELSSELGAVITLLKTDKPATALDTLSSSSLKRDRLKSIRTTGLITDERLLGDIADAYDKDKDNKGHTTANYKPTRKDVEKADLLIAKVARAADKNGGVWFTCQTQCVEDMSQKKAGPGYDKLQEGTKLVSLTCLSDTKGKYCFDGGKGIRLREAVYREEFFFDKLVLGGIKNRCRKDTRKNNSKAKKSLKLLDYKVVQPKVSPVGRGPGAQWKDMGETHQKTTMFRLEWKKWNEAGATEALRLKELDELLEGHGIVLDDDDAKPAAL